MDKYEYKVRSEEIKELIARREYAQAAEIADTIDWRRVKSVKMLCTISDLYKINRRYEDSRDMLLLAYDLHPSGRTIVYALCELSVKMGELPQAVEYCKEFVQIAPKDAGRYILQYKIYEAQEVRLEERIAVLEELKKRDYREKWAYELAYLYHRIGLASKCVDECDEMIVWFGDGKYVIKAMELKMLHQPLTPDQQHKYDNRFAPQVEEVAEEPVQEVQQEAVAETAVWSTAHVAEAMTDVNVEQAATKRIPTEEIEIQVKTMDPGQCNTINLQEEVAAGLRELWEGKEQDIENTVVVQMPVTTVTQELQKAAEQVMQDTEELVSEAEASQKTVAYAEQGIQAVTPMEAAQTMEPVQEVAEVVQEAIEAVNTMQAAESADGVQITEATQETAEAVQASEQAAKPVEAVQAQEEVKVQDTATKVMEQLRQENMAEPPKEMAKVLSMEADGQISFVMPEKEAIEKQITGQISIADIMAEWERMKKELEEKGKEKVRQHVKENTGQMFTEFEASVRDGLLEQLENGRDVESVIAQAEGRMVEDEEDEIPVPPSLMEPEEATESLIDVVDFQEKTVESIEIEAVEEAFVESMEADDEELMEQEEINETAQEAMEQEVVIEDLTEQEIAQEEPTQEVISEEVITSEDVVEELTDIEEITEEDAAYEAALVGAIGTLEEEVEEFAEDLEEEGSEEFVPEEFEAEESETEELEAEAEEDEVEPEAEPAGEAEEIEAEDSEEEQEGSKVRSLTKEEKELFSPYIQGRASKEQLIHALDNISMAAYTGNVIITGSEGLDTLGLAKNIIRDIQMTDSNFSGKIAKISGDSLNKRDVNTVLNGLTNGALIIQKAADMNDKTVDVLHKALQQENTGMVVVLEGTKKAINALLEKWPKLQSCFTARIDMEALSDAALVAFGKKYAREKECSIDELGILELHRIITDRQTNDHAVTIMEVKEIMDEAIESANRKSVGHFFDILMAKRYDEEDMIIIREKDFM